MTIINPKSIAGVTSITTPSGSDNLFTVHTNNTTERVRINNDGDVIVGSGITVSPDGDIFATGVTTSTTFVGALTGNVTGNISGGTVAGSTGTFTGDVDIADKIVHTGDTNTALRFPAADTITAETGGSERARIDSSGRLLVGSAAVTYNQSPLYVSGTDPVVATFHHSDGGTNDQARIALGALVNNPPYNRGVYLTAENNGNGHDFIVATSASHAAGPSERLRIDSSGRLGIQGAATKGVLDVRASGGSGTMLTAVFGANEGQTGGTLSDNADKGGRVGLYHYDTDEEPFGLFSYGSSNGSNSLNFGGGTSLMNAATNLGFFTAANSTTTTGTKRMDISSSGDVTINTGNLIMGTGGKGISFAADGNATGNTSELLHDYEEGSWSASSFNYDYDGNQAQRGHYVKVGRVVHAFFRVKFHTQSTHTGNHLRFTGLPFTAASGNPYDVNVGGFAQGYASIDFFRIYVAPNSTYAYWYTAAGNNFNNSTSLNSADVRGCITYTASS